MTQSALEFTTRLKELTLWNLGIVDEPQTSAAEDSVVVGHPSTAHAAVDCHRTDPQIGVQPELKLQPHCSHQFGAPALK